MSAEHFSLLVANKTKNKIWKRRKKSFVFLTGFYNILLIHLSNRISSLMDYRAGIFDRYHRWDDFSPCSGWRCWDHSFWVGFLSQDWLIWFWGRNVVELLLSYCRTYNFLCIFTLKRKPVDFFFSFCQVSSCSEYRAKDFLDEGLSPGGRL